jgi:hypothetical protein
MRETVVIAFDDFLVPYLSNNRGAYRREVGSYLLTNVQRVRLNDRFAHTYQALSCHQLTKLL